MPGFDLESLLSPLADDAPCGADLEYDPAFLALQAAASGRPEQQYGETVIAAEGPDWPAVHEQALALAARTRDLRLAVWLTRSGARLAGWPGAAQGLALAHGLLERHWAQVHPQLDAADNDDPTARLNALLPLTHADIGLPDLRAAALTGARGGPTARDVELVFGRAEPMPGETVPTEAGLTDALAAAAPELAEGWQAAQQAVQGMVSIVERRTPGRGPDFTMLGKLVGQVAQAGERARAQASGRPAGDADGARAPRGQATEAPGRIASREDAIRTLQRVCDWIEINEPSHPAPLLIRRAQRLLNKSFIDIVRDLMPDGIGQVERLAGIGHE